MRNVSYVLAIQGKMCYDHSYFSVIGQLESIKDLKKAYILTLKCSYSYLYNVSPCRQWQGRIQGTFQHTQTCVCVCVFEVGHILAMQKWTIYGELKPRKNTLHGHIAIIVSSTRKADNPKNTGSYQHHVNLRI